MSTPVAACAAPSLRTVIRSNPVVVFTRHEPASCGNRPEHPANYLVLGLQLPITRPSAVSSISPRSESTDLISSSRGVDQCGRTQVRIPLGHRQILVTHQFLHRPHRCPPQHQVRAEHDDAKCGDAGRHIRPARLIANAGPCTLARDRLPIVLAQDACTAVAGDGGGRVRDRQFPSASTAPSLAITAAQLPVLPTGASGSSSAVQLRTTEMPADGLVVPSIETGRRMRNRWPSGETS